MTKGINNWREAFWGIVLVAWILVGIAMLFEVGISYSTWEAGVWAIVVGFVAHVGWRNIIRPKLNHR